MEKALKLYTANRKPFPDAETHIELSAFTYDANRMGGAPSITGTVMDSRCLDNYWNDDVFVEFNGEKYFITQTPTSSKSNIDARYKHDVTFVSEREKLNNVFFFDVVNADSEDKDSPTSNSSSFSFHGDIQQFAKRLNASLRYSGLQSASENGVEGYVAIVDEGVSSEEMLLSFNNAPFSVALQESYNQFEIPYYFVGREIHFGYYQNQITETFRYGATHELLSITKNNANRKVINRCTGTGSSENIPYYYPNQHPQGELNALYNMQEGIVEIVDDALFAKNVMLGDVLERIEVATKELHPSSFYYKKSDYNKWAVDGYGKYAQWRNDNAWFVTPDCEIDDSIVEKYATSAMGSYANYDDLATKININDTNQSVAIRLHIPKESLELYKGKHIDISMDYPFAKLYIGIQTEKVYSEWHSPFMTKLLCDFDYEVDWENLVWKSWCSFSVNEVLYKQNWNGYLYIVLEKSGFDSWLGHVNWRMELRQPFLDYKWRRNNHDNVNIKDLGLSCDGEVNVGGIIISFSQKSYVQPMPTLMPPVYWATNGKERFYNANNGEYAKDDGTLYTFPNPYKESRRVEHIVDFPDIKPSLENILNKDGYNINSFIDFAYDEKDDDTIDASGNYVHPYFFAKLRRFDGEGGFNLFSHANEKSETTFSMTSGLCGACNFVLGVDSESKKNTVQVYTENVTINGVTHEKGSLKRDENGNVLFGAPQEMQNDTTNNEVWVALKKDTNTYGVIMPNASNKYYPSIGDTFTLIGITFPISYIRAAEKLLEKEIIKYMYDNNTEKFTFSIKFSRIYLEEHPEVLNLLNENALISIEYNGSTHVLYVSSFSYRMAANECLPEISVELAETLSASQNAFQAAISEVRTSVLDRVQKMDIAALVAANFLSKNDEDYAKQNITFNKGLKVGSQDNTVAQIDAMGVANLESAILRKYISTANFRDGFTGEGFKLWLDDKGLSHLTIDFLTARQRMTVYEMLISKLRSVNGEIFVSAANGRIKSVEETPFTYRLQLEDYNGFQIGDYIRCQVFRGADFKYYWVEVADIDGDTVVVNRSEFENTAPEVGDDVVLCGSKNIGRQNAIQISATEDGQPRIDILNGISTKSFANCLRTRLGNLDGIVDEHLQPHGDGLYSDNAFLKGDFVLKNRGESVDTLFAIQDGKIKSVVSTSQQVSSKDSVLKNASFTDGLSGWQTSNKFFAYLLNDSLIYTNDDAWMESEVDIRSQYNGSEFFVNIKNGWIKQLNGVFTNKGEFDENKTYPLNISLDLRGNENSEFVLAVGDVQTKMEDSFFIGVVTELQGSSLYFRTGDIIGLSHCYEVDITQLEDKTLPVDTIFLYDVSKETLTVDGVSYMALKIYDEVFDGDTGTYPNKAYTVVHKEIVQKGDSFKTVKKESSWNGQGDIFIYAMGNVDVKNITMYTDAIERKYATLFEQSEKMLKLAAMNFNEDGTVNKESGIVIQSEGAGLYAKDENGNQSKIAAYADGKVVLEGSEIQLKGNLTTDGNFKVREDGSIEAKNGLFQGLVRNMPVYVNDDNYELFFDIPEIGEFMNLKYTALASCLIFNLSDNVLPLGGMNIELPSLAANYTTISESDLEIIRSFIGLSVTIYNKTTKVFRVRYTGVDGESDEMTISGNGGYAQFLCKLGVAAGYETIYWQNTVTGGYSK